MNNSRGIYIVVYWYRGEHVNCEIKYCAACFHSFCLRIVLRFCVLCHVLLLIVCHSTESGDLCRLPKVSFAKEKISSEKLGNYQIFNILNLFGVFQLSWWLMAKNQIKYFKIGKINVRVDKLQEKYQRFKYYHHKRTCRSYSNKTSVTKYISQLKHIKINTS